MTLVPILLRMNMWMVCVSLSYFLCIYLSLYLSFFFFYFFFYFFLVGFRPFPSCFFFSQPTVLFLHLPFSHYSLPPLTEKEQKRRTNDAHPPLPPGSRSRRCRTPHHRPHTLTPHLQTHNRNTHITIHTSTRLP